MLAIRAEFHLERVLSLPVRKMPGDSLFFAPLPLIIQREQHDKKLKHAIGGVVPFFLGLPGTLKPGNKVTAIRAELQLQIT